MPRATKNSRIASDATGALASGNGSGFVEYEGKVHLISPALGGEHTMCGDAFDAYSSENAPEREFKATKRRTVTCERCAMNVLACRGVKVRTTNEKLSDAGGKL